MVLVVTLAGCSADRGCDLPTAEACWNEGAARLREPAFDLRAAATRFDQACRGGYPRACADLAVLLQDGRGVPRDTERAVALDQQACDAGLGVACSNLGMMYRLGAGGVRMDPAEADRWFTKALAAYRASCSGPQPTYCANLGWMLESGLGTPADPEQALVVWKQGCDGGDGEACVNRLVRDLEASRDIPRAVADLRTDCLEGGVPSACSPLARSLGPNEVEAATKAARRGCSQGDGPSCAVLGFLRTRDEPSDGAAAWNRACDLGVSDGCTAVFDLLLGGSPGPTERDSALEHLAQACRIGDPRACQTAASLYRSGDLGRTDAELVRSFETEACRMGAAESCVALLRDEVELPLIPDLRDKFLADACSRGVAEACALRPPAPAP
jgi:hypothetical protein